VPPVSLAILVIPKKIIAFCYPGASVDDFEVAQATYRATIALAIGTADMRRSCWLGSSDANDPNPT
jgi:hypothetical protein